MTNEEGIQYLANIYYLLRIDGSIDRAEEKVFEKIGKAVGVGYFDMSKAKDLSAEEGFSIKVPDRFSDRIRCLEDMLVVAYSDKSLHPMEKKILAGYAKNLGLSREQLSAIQEESKALLKALLK